MKAIETTYKGYRFRGKELPAPQKKKISSKADITNNRFGRAIALELLGNTPTGYKWWGLICDCGTKFAARSRELTRGHTRSCGCLQKETRCKGGWNKLGEGQASANELLASYKKSAIDRGYEWGLSRVMFIDLVSSPCGYCGEPPNKERKPNKGVNGGFMYSGIDRIVNTQGYVEGNVISCCWVCNRAKAQMTLSEFLSWISKLTTATAAREARFEHGQTPT